jgi:tRNA-dihydrouridine synthase B
MPRSQTTPSNDPDPGLRRSSTTRRDTSDGVDGPRGMNIGPVHLANNLILAPMAGVTDRPFRSLCRRFGAGLAVSEMLSANPALSASRKSRERADHCGEPGPIAVQIAGADPRQMADAARLNVDRGAEIIDINMGCPAKKVCRSAAGSALLRDEPLVQRILEAVVAAVPVPVTLKTRTGWCPESRNLQRIAHVARESGIAMLAVHGRTRACGWDTSAELDSLRALRDQTDLPLAVNGDIRSPQQAADALRYTGADAVMVGRAAQGRPWIFREITHCLTTGELLPEPAPGWIRKTLLAHLHELYTFYGETRGVRIARKHIGWYWRGQESGRPADDASRDAHQRESGALLKQFLDQINRAETAQQQADEITAYFDRRLQEDITT